MTMADKKAEAAPVGEKKKGLPLKPIIAVAVVLLLEAVVIVGLFSLGGGPGEIQAEPGVADEVALGEKPAESLVVAGKFQNTRTGRSFMYDTEIYVVVKQKNLEQVEKRKEAMHASITKDITTIFRRAEPSFLREQELATLTRQVKAVLNERFGSDNDGEPVIQEVLIAKCMEFASDY